MILMVKNIQIFQILFGFKTLQFLGERTNNPEFGPRCKLSLANEGSSHDSNSITLNFPHYLFINVKIILTQKG